MNPTFDASSYETDAFDRGTVPVLRIISLDQARQLVKYQADDSLRERIDELAEKSNEGSLSGDERAEFEGYVRANKFVAILQAQARKFLTGASE